MEICALELNENTQTCLVSDSTGRLIDSYQYNVSGPLRPVPSRSFEGELWHVTQRHSRYFKSCKLRVEASNRRLIRLRAGEFPQTIPEQFLPCETTDIRAYCCLKGLNLVCMKV